MYHKCDKRKPTTPTATFVSHYSNIDDFTGIFEIIFNILLFGRVQNASNKELNIDWISNGFGFLNGRLLHGLSQLKLLLTCMLFLFWLNLSGDDLCLT